MSKEEPKVPADEAEEEKKGDCLSASAKLVAVCFGLMYFAINGLMSWLL